MITFNSNTDYITRDTHNFSISDTLLGAQSNGCKFNKKPLYRYSGCHGYDASAFNIVLGLTLHLDDSQYSLPSSGRENMFYKETLEQATKILENRRRNSSDTSDHPFTEDWTVFIGISTQIQTHTDSHTTIRTYTYMPTLRSLLIKAGQLRNF